MDRLMELFYEYPNKKFTVREIAKKTGLSKSTVHNKIKRLNLLRKDKTINETDAFRIRKVHYYIEKMFQVGLIDFINMQLSPSCIILFGSFRKGESAIGSDIDLFVETTKKSGLDFSRFEKKLKHEIQLFVEKDINKLPKNLFNNVINGIKLQGYIKLK